MQLSSIVDSIVKNITIDEYEKQEKRASIENKFRFAKDSWNETCDVCGKESNRTGYSGHKLVCSSCARKIARAVLISVTMKNIRNKEYSRGVGYGYKLATGNAFGFETVEFIKMVVEDAESANKTVHFLGRDMDVLFMAFSLKDNVNYLAGWNRDFQYKSVESKKKLLAVNNVQEGDFVIDTGFVGSIINDIRAHVNVKGYLLSATPGNQYTYLYDEHKWDYRDWVVQIEHFDRARKVIINDETNLPTEVYTKPSWFEDGLFHGFVKGVSNLV